MSEEIEGKVSKKLSQEFSKTESQILGTLSKLREFFLNPQVWSQSRTVRRKSGNSNTENQEPNGDRSQNDPHPEVGTSTHWSPQSSNKDLEETSYKCRMNLK